MGIEKVLGPASVAVVGPTDKTGAFGCYVAQNALASLISDRLYFVNPKREQLFGRKCYARLRDLPEVPDCVAICTPASTVNGLLREAGELGVGGAVVFASGFAEALGEQGRAMEREMGDICREYGIALIGPNCVGVANNLNGVYLWGLNLPFEPARAEKGAGVIAQSGSLIGGVCHKEHANVVMAISSGNGNILPLEECVEYMVDDPRITTVIVYMEGIKNGRCLCAALAKAARLRKPVIILKAGKSAQGAKSAASHTGNMTGDRAAFDAVMRKYGVISVDSADEFVCMAQMVAILDGEYPAAGGSAAISFSGGESTVMADLCDRAGIELPDLQARTVELVSTYLPDFATARNPLDATTAMFSEEDKFYRVFRAVAEDPSVGSVILSMELTGEANARHSCSMNALKRYAAEPGGKAMVFVHPFYENTRNSAWRAELAGLRIPVLGCGESGLAALRKVLDFAAYRPEDHDLSFAAHEKSRSGKTFALSEHESKILVAEQGIPVPKQFLAVSRESLLAGLKEVGYPAVLKVDSPDILHKTDSGGVRLGIAGEQEALAAFDDILDTCRSRFPRARIKGVQVQEMIPGGIEIILGVKNDPQLGPMLLVGMGGIFTELLRDVAIAPCPVNRKDAGLMLRSLKSYRLLEGYRGAPPADVGALEEMMVGLSRFAAANRDTIAEMELNPVLVRESGAVAVDALVVKYEE